MASLEALGLASNIIQLIGFVGKLITSAKVLYESSRYASAGSLVLQDVANDLTRLSSAVLSPDGQANEGLKQLAQSAKDIAESLLTLLDDMRVKGRKTKWKSFKLAIKEVRNEETVALITNNITRLQTQMILHLQVQLREDIGLIHLSIQRLQNNSDHLQLNHTRELNKLRVDLLDTVNTINTTKNQANKQDGSREMSVVLDLERLTIGDIRTISQKLPGYTSKMSTLGQGLDAIADSQAIIESFWFDKFTAREDNVTEAHAKTFEWIFRGVLPDGTTNTGFSSWLESGNGIFWVRGKAGSGKSTLMKFINQHPMTLQHLRSWAGSQQLVTGKFYFWNSGTDLQRSQEGLLRSLIFEILRQCPELAIYAETKLRSADNRSSLMGLSTSSHAAIMTRTKDLTPRDIAQCWKLNHLAEILCDVLRHDETKKFFFAIDGLDEYEARYTEDHQRIVNVLRELAVFRNVKICVSSRPWTVFMDAFNQDADQSLKLEDLTKHDIRSYITEKFKAHNQYSKLIQKDTAYCFLVDDVTEKSRGVFLWVFLVVRELLDGLTYNDTIEIMRQRVDSFPDSLEKFFQHMLDPIPKIYRTQTARIFKVAMSCEFSLPMILYSFLEDINNDPSLVLQKTHRPLETPEFLEHQDKIQRRLDAYCKGLLEIVEPVEGTGNYCPIRPEVDFFHQSVRGFLLSGTVIPALEYPKENIWLQLCQAIALLFKRFPLENRWQRMIQAEALMYYAKKAQDTGTDCDTVNKSISDAFATMELSEGFLTLDDIAFEDTRFGIKDFIGLKVLSLSEREIHSFVSECLTNGYSSTPEVISLVIACVEGRGHSSKAILKNAFESYLTLSDYEISLELLRIIASTGCKLDGELIRSRFPKNYLELMNTSRLAADGGKREVQEDVATSERKRARVQDISTILSEQNQR